jgi:hypothetical protein
MCRLRVGFPHEATGQFHRTSIHPTPSPIPPLPPLILTLYMTEPPALFVTWPNLPSFVLEVYPHRKTTREERVRLSLRHLSHQSLLFCQRESVSFLHSLVMRHPFLHSSSSFFRTCCPKKQRDSTRRGEHHNFEANLTILVKKRKF